VFEALGKGFVECHTWQKALDKKTNNKASFAECRLSGTRQRKGAVTALLLVTATLPRARHSAKFFLKKFFAERPLTWRSVKIFF
jgi:hypothetical protein